MMTLLLWILVFAISIAVLLKGSEWLTDAAVLLSRNLGISTFLIGLTVVSIGTSLPELASSVAAVLAGDSSIVAGNVVGSNIANILLVLGLGAIIAGSLSTRWEHRDTDFAFLFGATFLFILFALDGTIIALEAAFLLAFYLVYLVYLSRNHTHRISRAGKKISHWALRIAFPLVAGGALVYLGAKYTIKSVLAIASLTGVSSSVIAVTAVALGTSLPELMVTIVAVVRHEHGIALGNIFGSNVFNLLGVAGLTGLVGQLVIPSKLLSFGIPVMIAATVLLYLSTLNWKVTRWEGTGLFLLYVFFIAFFFV